MNRSDMATQTANIADIQPELVDPDLIEAREIVAKCCVWFSLADAAVETADDIRAGKWDGLNYLVQDAFRAIKRGREVAEQVSA